MAKTAEDNFRIEVWDRDEQALSETISRSPDSTVSQAAWQAAIRRRPGMLLIHYNSRHVMEKILTPGEVKIPPQAIIDGSVHSGLDVALGDLRECVAGLVQILFAPCNGKACRAHRTLWKRRSVQFGRASALLHEL